jgi:hypothetical protein
MLGDAVGVGHLGRLRELILEIYSSKKVKFEVCLNHFDVLVIGSANADGSL